MYVCNNSSTCHALQSGQSWAACKYSFKFHPIGCSNLVLDLCAEIIRWYATHMRLSTHISCNVLLLQHETFYRV